LNSTSLEHLKDDIRWQSMGQRDPLVEFKAEAFSAFSAFQDSLKQEIVRYLFHAEIQVSPPEPQPLEGVAIHPEAEALATAAATPAPASEGPVASPAPPPRVAAAPAPAVPVSRNALCPCGSGRKYKRCHGASA
jgi:preprotein translocase subunit SecA